MITSLRPISTEKKGMEEAEGAIHLIIMIEKKDIGDMLKITLLLQKERRKARLEPRFIVIHIS